VKNPGLARLRPLLALLIALTVAVLLFEATRPYRPDNVIDAFIDSLIGRDFSESELDTVVRFELESISDIKVYYGIGH
jgi:hypothetical protein